MTTIDNQIWSPVAIQLGRIQVEYEALCTGMSTLTVKQQTSALLSMCSRENLSYKCFKYLEDQLITNKESR